MGQIHSTSISRLICWSCSVQQSASLPLMLSCWSSQVRFSGHSLGSWFPLIVNPVGPWLYRSCHQRLSHTSQVLINTPTSSWVTKSAHDLDADFSQFEGQIIFKSQHVPTEMTVFGIFILHKCLWCVTHPEMYEHFHGCCNLCLICFDWMGFTCCWLPD